ncbi:hypothetical protein E2C01_021126 [Portunus trituberculatus]|uniref:Uncharacterized protein n=1 Tax=Portunus trituberculatus TaxID=210409 RepID=A0A5B7E454_PORTR|nr:hypothetical protein [Portunus trituberculatus]
MLPSSRGDLLRKITGTPTSQSALRDNVCNGYQDYNFLSTGRMSQVTVYLSRDGLRLNAAVVQWNHACFWVRGVSKRTSLNPVHGPSVGWASSLRATVS